MTELTKHQQQMQHFSTFLKTEFIERKNTVTPLR